MISKFSIYYSTFSLNKIDPCLRISVAKTRNDSCSVHRKNVHLCHYLSQFYFINLYNVHLSGLEENLDFFFKKLNLVGFFVLLGLGFVMVFFELRLGFYKKAQLDGFWDFYGFSVIRMSTAR